MSTNLRRQIFPTPFVLVALFALTGCATNFAPPPLSADHPASIEAEEAPRTGMQKLSIADDLTRKTNVQLARSDVPAPAFQSGGVSQDMGGMDHSQMKGMDMKKQPAAAPTSSGEGMDHSRMPGMSMPVPSAEASPAGKENVEMEMKKTSDEMKRVSDELKAKSDQEASPTKPFPKSSEAGTTRSAYWTCVMHPEIHADKPGQCPKCGMTLVKKEGTPK